MNTETPPFHPPSFTPQIWRLGPQLLTLLCEVLPRLAMLKFQLQTPFVKQSAERGRRKSRCGASGSHLTRPAAAGLRVTLHRPAAGEEPLLCPRLPRWRRFQATPGQRAEPLVGEEGLGFLISPLLEKQKIVKPHNLRVRREN